MNTSRLVTSALTILVAVALLACGATRARRHAPPDSGFLRDYSQLEPNPDYPAQEVYLNPDAVWSRYDTIWIESVSLWGDEQTDKLTHDEKEMLTQVLYTSLHEKLGAQFELGRGAGERTLELRAALTQAKASPMASRVITTFVPQAFVLGTAVGLTADTARTVGSATAEAEVLDSITKRRLAAAVSSRAGTKSLVSGRTFQKWGDVKAAADFWATQTTRSLVRLGVRRKTAAPAP